MDFCNRILHGTHYDLSINVLITHRPHINSYLAYKIGLSNSLMSEATPLIHANTSLSLTSH